MSWRDFFYFSKGERSGLIVLLCLITIAGILLILNNKPVSFTDSANNTSQIKGIQADEESVSSNTSLKPDLVNANPSQQTVPSKAPTDNTVVSEKNVNVSTGSELKTANNKESVKERVQRLTSYSQPSYTRIEKFKEGTVVELNTADTTILKKVPGIGSAFAKRIVGYRNLLGGYYSVTQLSEVYGIDEDKYNALETWFIADPSLISTLAVNNLSQDSLSRHPYISYGQAKIITQLRKQKGKLTGWENLQLLNEFTDADKIRLQYYISFE